MASRPKSGGTGTRRSSARSRKPATIDLEAKEVVSESTKTEKTEAKPASQAKTSASKSGSTGKTSDFGRPASSGAKAAPKKTAPVSKAPEETDKDKNLLDDNKPKSSDKPEEGLGTSKVEAPKSGGSGFVPAIGGALAAVLALGLVGQFDGARNLPLIGNLYGGNAGGSGFVQEDQFSDLQNKVNSLAENSAGAGFDPQPINNKLAELETLVSSLAETASAGSASLDPALVSRLEAVEAGLKNVQDDLAGVAQGSGAVAGVTTEDLNAALATVSSRIESLEQSGNSVATEEKVAALESKFGEVSAELAALEALLTKNDSQLSELITQSSKLEDTVATVQASEKVAKSVAVTALATALDNDDSLTLPVSSVEALLGEMPETTRLKELANTGIPKVKELVAQLDSFTNSVGNPGAVSPDASLSDKFWANAQSLVTFRSTGPREGDDPLAILSRVRAEVSNGNLQTAKSEWSKLPADIQKRGEIWIGQLDQRIEAYALQKEISAKLSLQAG